MIYASISLDAKMAIDLTTNSHTIQVPAKNPPKSVRFSPDGSVVAAVKSDSQFRVYSRDLEVPLLNLNSGGDVYDFDFYPGFSADIGASRSVLIGSRNRPIRLFNVGSGVAVSAYTAYSFAEEIIHPLSIRFSPQCQTILGGFPQATVRVWNVQHPGRQTREIVFSTRKSKTGQKGIISAIEYCDENIFYAGSYSNSICMYDMRDKNICVEIGTGTEFGGVVQLKAKDHALISGHRMDTQIHVWDMRNPGTPLMSLPRIVKTQQRFEFALYSVSDKQLLLTGDHYGDLTVFDLSKDGEIVFQKNISENVPLVSVAAASDGTLATASGMRHFPRVGIPDSSESEEMEDDFTGHISIHSLVLS